MPKSIESLKRQIILLSLQKLFTDKDVNQQLIESINQLAKVYHVKTNKRNITGKFENKLMDFAEGEKPIRELLNGLLSTL
jgi:septation ring formation regulator EzrA